MNHPVPPAPLRRPFPAELLTALKAAFGERASTAEAVRAHHGRDESPFDPQLPDAVVFARNTEEVQTIVRLCGQYNVPIIPYGNGSSLEGHLLAVQGGVSIDLSEMNRVLVDQRRRPDRHRRARHLAQAVERSAARHRPVFPDRPGR